MDAVAKLVRKYRKIPFDEGLLPFEPNLKALGTSFATICAKPDGRQRWVICDVKSGRPALLSHAGLIAEPENMETGNYVPSNEEIPMGVLMKNVQRRANSKCMYTCVLDTHEDMSMYEGQWALDAYVGKLDGFNPTSRPRREYQSGRDERYRSRFYMQTPIYLRKSADDAASLNLNHLHPWVMRGERESTMFRANPDRPRVWVRAGGKTIPIKEGTPGVLQRGDVVAFSFTVTYHITSVNWFPQFHPADIVVLKVGPGDPTDYSGPVIDLYNRPPPVISSLEDDQSDSHSDDGDLAARSSGEAIRDQLVVEEDTSQEDGATNGRTGDAAAGSKAKDVEYRIGVKRMHSSDTLTSVEESGQQTSDGFEVVENGDIEDGVTYEEEFVDVAGEVDKRTTRGGSGKSSRVRKRPRHGTE